jgi:hypothetical protein
MFQHQPTPAKNWAVDLLTTEYLISGTIDGDHYQGVFHLGRPDISSIPVSSARMQPTGNVGLPDALTAPWAVAYADTLVAIIPRDQASLDFALKTNADWKAQLPAEVYVSHYLIRGTLLNPSDNPRAFVAFTAGLAIQQAQITSLLPGARLSGLSAPYLLLVSRHKHFARPLA